MALRIGVSVSLRSIPSLTRDLPSPPAPSPPSYEAHHKLRYTDEALMAAAKYSSQYISDRFLPDKVRWCCATAQRRQGCGGAAGCGRQQQAGSRPSRLVSVAPLAHHAFRTHLTPLSAGDRPD